MALTVGNHELFRGFPLACLGLGTVTFLVLRLGEALGGLSGWQASYLDDFICLPLVLGLVLAVHRWRGSDPGMTLPISHGVVALLLFSIHFEVVLPRLSAAYTADPLDVVMYTAGWCVFRWGINRPVSA